MHLRAPRREASDRWKRGGEGIFAERGIAAAWLVAALLPALLAGCRREAPAPEKVSAYVHPDYQRLSRADLLIESQRKGVMGRKRSLEHVRRTVEVTAPLVAEAVRQEAIQGELRALAGSDAAAAALREELRLLQEADLLLESGGDPEAVSSAGAVGVAQWLAGTGRRAGLHVDEREYARIAARMRSLRAAIAALRQRPADWSRSEQPGGAPLTRDQWVAMHERELKALDRQRLEADERRDPRKAVFAQTRYLVKLWRRFGSLDWALQAYHGGERGAERTIGYFVSEGGTRPVSFPDLYFGTTPRRTPKTFSYLYGRADDHRYYGWRVLMAQRAIALYRRDPEGFRGQWESLVPGHPIDRAWYPAELDAPFADVAALQAAYRSGRLVAIPDDAARYGFAPRAVAPLDPANERWYRGLRPEALGMLQRLAALYREEGGRAPLRVVGAAGTIGYAAREQGIEDHGTTGPRDDGTTGPETRDGGTGGWGEGETGPALTLHAVGLCVDVARPEDPWDRKVLEYALSSLGDRMRVGWLRDRSADAYHLCPNPAFAAQFLLGRE